MTDEKKEPQGTGWPDAYIPVMKRDHCSGCYYAKTHQVGE